MDIQGKVALVTGGAHRVGKSIALALAHEGSNLAITYHTAADEAQATVREIEQFGGQASAYPCDQRDLAAIARLFDQLRHGLDHLDILINSAAIMERRSVLDVTADDWSRVIDTNLRGPFFMAQAAARWMIERKVAGAIVNIADLSALHPWPSYITHTISKSGCVTMTKALALALAPTIRVNAIAAGAVLKPRDWDDKRWTKVSTALPLRRGGSAEDVAEAVLFCLHNDFITGQTIVVDGGRSLKA